MKLRVGERLRALREGAGVTQEKLREVIGVDHRQTIGQIENDERRVTLEELMKALDFFGVSMDRFTNPFIPLGKQEFSWRRSEADPEGLQQFEDRAREWIGAYQELGRELGEKGTPLRFSLDLTARSSFEEAADAGEAMAVELGLGDVPSKSLATAMQDKLGILVLMVDAIPGISGAASTLPDLNVALINRQEPEGRRNFDLAHELFHLLTWATMPPSWIDGEAANPGDAKRLNRIEQLAENFAAGILMPRYALDALGQPEGDLVEWTVAKAEYLGVSAPALKWRLVNTGICAEIRGIDDSEFRQKRTQPVTNTPALFSAKFAARISTGITKGLISVRKAASLTDLTIEALGDVFDEHGVARPSTMGG